MTVKAEKLVYLVTTDIKFGIEFSQQAGHYGYPIEVCSTTADFDFEADNVLAVLVDISGIEKDFSSDGIARTLAPWQSLEVPVMYISENDDQEVRLECVRSRGTAFFKKPLDVIGVIDWLGDLLHCHQTPMPRVLIIEDQPSVATYYELILKKSGMDTFVVTNPYIVLEAIKTYHPDLILLDLYMPGVNGFELAKMIRQHDCQMHIPIIYLSSETDVEKQILAMNMGGDEFLTKPVKSSFLVTTIKRRLERSQVYQALMVQDSLTGVYMHTGIMERLSQEVERYKQTRGEFVLAMIDIDNITDVNHSYGFKAGDQMIMSLSRLLLCRLRSTDIIGRYGGEEFMVIMANTDESSAVSVMENLRLTFAQIIHSVQDVGEFTGTFSCGLAVFSEHPSEIQLREAALGALDLAKTRGKNCVVRSSTG